MTDDIKSVALLTQHLLHRLAVIIFVLSALALSAVTIGAGLSLAPCANFM